MDSQKADMFIMCNRKYFGGNRLIGLREALINMDESRWMYLQSAELKDPTISLVISIVGGTLGIDRFYLGDTGLGIIKLLTCGGLGIWTIIDWFLIMNITRDKNLVEINKILY
jgi:TM2 domain-containing membrane protein YozV